MILPSENQTWENNKVAFEWYVNDDVRVYKKGFSKYCSLVTR